MDLKQPGGKDSEETPAAPEAGSSQRSQADPSLETLREILFSQDRQRIVALADELDALEQRITDKDAFVAAVVPVLGDAIRRKIRDSRDEMVEALYPIIGQMIVRAVSEAIRDLARNIDAQMRQSFNLGMLGRRLQARLGGVSDAEIVLRESLPFDIAEIFLIHRETGLLLWHVSRAAGTSADSGLISSMLTAIRDFVADTFGRGEEGQLDMIEYGERRVLIEAAQYAYLAVVIEGVEPPGFRAEMRQRIIQISQTHEATLRAYDGDPTPLAPVEAPLSSLMMPTSASQGLSRRQKQFIAMVVGLSLLCMVGAYFSGTRVWQFVRTTPTPIFILFEPTPLALTAIPPPSLLTPTPSATTSGPVPTPVTGVMKGNVWLYREPSVGAVRLGVILARGQSGEILAAFDDWYKIRWTPQPQTEVTGWAAAKWVETTTPLPDQIVTPTPGP